MTEYETTTRDQGPGDLLTRMQSRRRFLAGAGIALSAVAIEGIGGLLRAVYGRTADSSGPWRGGSAERRSELIHVEQLVPGEVERPPAQPSQTVRYRPDLRLRIGQMLLVGFHGTGVDASSPIVEDIVARGLGGVVLFDRSGARLRNISSPGQLAGLVSGLQHASASSTHGGPLFVAVDQEGGTVARLAPHNGFPGTYSPVILGQINDPAFTEAQGAAVARTLASVGINFNLAPVVDLNVSPSNPIIGGSGRSFSGDAAIAAAHAAAFIRGHHAAGVLTAIKHFPGQGSATGDTHHGAVDVTGRWTDYELQPFASLINQGLVDAVMTAHIYNASIDRDHPATLSAPTIGGMLRDRLGYGGVVISDDLTMQAIAGRYRYEDAVSLAVQAGVDILTIAEAGDGLVRRTIDIIEGLVAGGVVPEARIDASYDRIQALKGRLVGA